jgi:hypothetical protein
MEKTMSNELKDAMKYYSEQQAKQSINSYISNSTTSHTTIDDSFWNANIKNPYYGVTMNKEQLEARIKRLEQSLEQERLALQEISKMKFKHGDAAFHPKHGNVLIRDVWPANYSDMGVHTPMGLPAGTSGYHIITVDTQCWVASEELLEISEMTKVLYNKNK